MSCNKEKLLRLLLLVYGCGSGIVKLSQRARTFDMEQLNLNPPRIFFFIM